MKNVNPRSSTDFNKTNRADGSPCLFEFYGNMDGGGGEREREKNKILGMEIIVILSFQALYEL